MNLKTTSRLLLPALALASVASFAEGTKEVSPNTSNISALGILPNQNRGTFLGAPSENRIYFNIADLEERLYFGFNWTEYGGSTASGTNMYMKIFGPNGVQVGNNIQLSNSGAGYIANYTEAVNGPDIGGITNGYTPKVFVPAETGEHYIVLYRSANGGSSQDDGDQWSKAMYFDFTVANNTTAVKAPGRVFCQKWALVATSLSNAAPNANASASPTIYSYSTDETILKITFQDGFKPIAYDIAVNNYGVSNTGNFAVDRRSANFAASPALSGGYKLFLNSPDQSLYPVTPITSQPEFAAEPITGCGGNYILHFNMPAAGDARLLLDMNGIPGYQDNSTDRLIEVFNVPAGAGSVAWDGLDGAGNTVLPGAAMSISTVYQRGRFNLPIYDAEINKNGFNVETIAPISLPNNRLYWDDSQLTNIGTTCNSNSASNNITTAGINNSIIGTVSPTHAWSGNGNPLQQIPAPEVNNNESDRQCDDFGNVRVINSWGWALQSSSTSSILTFGCFTVSGNVYNDANGLRDNLVNGTGTNISGGLHANLVNTDGIVVATVPVSSTGTYSFNDVIGYTFDVVLTTTPGVEGSALPAATLPAGWVATGEQLGTTTGNNIDAVNDGRLRINVTGNTADVNFGLNQLPEAIPVTTTIPVPVVGQEITLNGTNGITPVPVATDPEDGNLGQGDAIVITTLPTNTTLLYNGTPVTAGQVINGFTPGLLKVLITAATNGSTQTSFQFSYEDAAGKQGPAPANYIINWGTPLPVHLAAFTAAAEQSRSRLNWVTVAERNNKGFFIERSADGRNWSENGFVATRAPGGNSDKKTEYVAYDEKPFAGINYYRLKQVDIDGKTALSEVRKVVFGAEGSISIYPNPAMDQFSIVINDKTSVKEVRLTDVNGKVVYRAAEVSAEISLKGMATGIYLLQVEQNNGTVSSFKLMKK
jgi:hypothetical protein